MTETILSFVGFSSSNIPTWGSIIADSRPYIYQAWWAMAYPTLVIMIAVLGLNALGDGLRQATDPLARR